MVVPYDSTFIIPVTLAQSLHAIFAVLLLFGVFSVHGTAGWKRMSARDLLIEAVLPYALMSVLFMSTYCGASIAANVFLPMLVQIQVRYSQGLIPSEILTISPAWL